MSCAKKKVVRPEIMNERKIDYLRISLTDRCNLRCRYCMPQDIASVPMEEILTYEEICEIARAAAQEGIRHVRVTGGEPLVRKGCPDCIRMLKEIPGIETVMMTTNGILLQKFLPELLEAGLDGVNISLDTLQRERYREITGYDGLEKVLGAVEACIQAGIRTKINVAAAYGLNDSELLDLAGLSEKWPVDVRFIEMMPIGYGTSYHGIDNRQVLEQLRERYPGLTEADPKKDAGFGPAEYVQIPGFRGRTGLISPIHGKFCGNCNRLRLTSTGKLKYCLCYEDAEDLRIIVRSGDPPEKRRERIRQMFRGAGKRKPLEHHFEQPDQISEKKKMSEIGG